MKLSYLMLLLLMNFFWAAVYSAYKLVGQDDLSAGGIVTIRFGLAGLMLAAAWPLYKGPAPRGRQLLLTCVMGLLLYTVGQRLQVYGNQIGTAGDSAVLMGLEPILTSVAAAIFLREHIGPRRMGGFALGLAGIALLNGVWRRDFHWGSLGASLVFSASFIFEAAYSVMGKPIVARASVMKMLAISLLAGTLANCLIDGPGTLEAARKLSASSWILLATMALICTAVGYSVWFVVIRECPVNLAALTVFAQAVFGVAIAWLWIREPLHLGQLLGCGAIVAGLVLGFSRQLTRSGREPAAATAG